MPKSSYNQTDFTGGEWGPLAQGRSQDPRYTTALGICLNQYPVEEGPVARRSGTMFIVPTHNRSFAKLLSFDGSPTCSFAMEFTDLKVRFITQSSLVFDSPAYTILTQSANQFTFTGVTSPTWVPGDDVMFVFPDASSSLFPYPQASEGGLRNRVCHIQTISDSGGTTTFSVVDDLGNALDHSTWTSATAVGAQIMHVTIKTTPYSGADMLSRLRAVQAESQSVILVAEKTPQVIRITTNGSLTTDPIFSFAALTMKDGPYLDPQTMSLSLSGISGAVTATAGSAAFAATDVGRLLRVFTRPADWASGTTYASGDKVTGPDGGYWISLIGSNTGVTPGTSTVVAGVPTLAWAPDPTAASWAWGTITAFSSATVVTLTFDTSLPDFGLQTANGTTAAIWQLGVYSNTTTYPTCGGFYEGRLWFAGAIPNRFDTTTSNGFSELLPGIAIFSPTDAFDNVLDESGLSFTFNSKRLANINWMVPQEGGILMGRLSGETLVGASTLGDPITPTSIQEHENTAYGSSVNVEPTKAGVAIIFPQKYGRRLMEYFGDAYSGKYSGRHLNKMAKHMTKSGVAELAYQEEAVPIVWARMGNGLLAGCTYRRHSRFITQDPECEAWHWHMHGAGRVFTGMCVVPGNGGLLDRLFAVTNEPPPTPIPDTGVIANYFIEVLEPFFDADNSLANAWFCDQAPGSGAGNSGFDCGGGNYSTFTPTGSTKGTDSVGAVDMATVAPFPALAAAPTGQSPPAGGGVLLAKGKAAYFPGSVTLTGLPPFPSGGRVNERSISMSVWVGRTDMPYQGGMLLESPALDSPEVIAAHTTTSGLLGGAPTQHASNKSIVAGTSNGASGPTFAEAANNLAIRSWTHVMISCKDDGGGNMLVTCVFDDTTIFSNATIGPYGGNIPMWPFASQQDKIKNVGLCTWTIGGANAITPKFSYVITDIPGPNRTIVVPSLINLLKIGVGQTLGFGYNPIGQPLLPAPSGQQLIDLIFKGKSYTVPASYPTKVTAANGISNVPYSSVEGGYSGFLGSVAELWIMPNQYIDWTNSTNRNKFHEYDSITDSFGPISLGKAGATPGFGTPWIYCSGNRTQFPLNRANGVYLTVQSTQSTFPGLSESPLNFPS